MDTDLESRILELLERAPTRRLPLREVYRVLTAEFGVRAGTLAELRARLRSDPGLLFVVEPESPLGDGNHWPDGAHSAYEAALRQAGFDAGPWVTAISEVPVPDPDAPAAVIRRSLLDLMRTAARRPGLRAAIASALAELRGAGLAV